MKLQFSVLFLLVLSLSKISGQNENNTWIFSSTHGLNFNTEPPTLLENTGLKLNNSSASSVSDLNGNLLFYSDGEHVYNKTFTIMENGGDLYGDTHSSHAALIIAQEHSKGLYYLFTNASGPEEESNLYLHIVDMNLNEGLGQVVEKNTLVTKGVTEVMASTQDPCGNVYIVYSTEDKNIILQKVDQNGLGSKKTFFNNQNNNFHNYYFGEMIFSNNGDYLINSFYNDFFDIYSFDWELEELTFIKRVITESNSLLTGFTFSPNDSLLYFSKFLLGEHRVGISQFKFHELLTSQNVPPEYSLIQKNITPPQHYTLELGPDGKIYCSQKFSEYISVIRNPNGQEENADFLDLDIYIGSKGFFSVDFQNKVYRIGDVIQIDLFDESNLSSCAPIWLKLDADYDSIYWSTGQTRDSIFLENSGTYSVEVFINGCSFMDTIIYSKVDLPDILPDEIVLCAKEDEEEFCLTTFQDWNAYKWQDGSKNNELCVTEPGLYSVEVTGNGCVFHDTVIVSSKELSEGIAEDTLFLCNENTICIQATIGAETFLWSNGSTISEACFTEEGLYYLSLTNGNCVSVDSVFVLKKEFELPYKVSDTTICPGESIFLDLPYANVEWWNGENSNSIEINEPGNYEYKVNIQGCEISASFIVSEVLCESSCKIYIPNVFSPNNDGVNDHFVIFSNCELDLFSLKIFDRYGSLVFATKDINKHWESEKFTSSVYVAKLEFSFSGTEEIRTSFATVTKMD